MCFPAIPFSHVKVTRKCNTIPKGNHLAASNHSSLIAHKFQAGSGSPAKVLASVTFNKTVQQLGIGSQLQWLLDMCSCTVLGDDMKQEMRNFSL